jgi:altronate hydrolase
MNGDIDFNAGAVLDGTMTLDQAALSLAALVRKVASGELSKPEKLGHREYFIPYKHQDTPGLLEGCRA